MAAASLWFGQTRLPVGGSRWHVWEVPLAVTGERFGSKAESRGLPVAAGS